MIERENFYGILIKTIKSYCSLVRNTKIDVTFDEDPDKDLFRVFKRGGFISRPRKPRGAYDYLTAEYNIRNSILKYLAGKCLTYLIYNTRSFGRDKDIHMTKGVFGQNELISPQNRSIRFFDYDKKTVDCIIKEGFTQKYFKNQLEFRKNYQYDFLVPLLDCGEIWFREPILKGHPLARVTDDNLYERGIRQALACIQKLSEDTVEYDDYRVYVEKLVKKANLLTLQAEEQKQIGTANKGKQLVAAIAENALSVDMKIPLCQSHGDLQTGNIWCKDDGSILLYDWETSGKRSIWYDSVTLLYSLRRHFGWRMFYYEKEPDKALTCDSVKKRSKNEYKAIKDVVLLEDYLFFIEDMMELPSTWGAEIFDNNIDRIFQVVYDS